MIKKLICDQKTHRAWNGRDDVSQHYMGRIPLTERSVSLVLTWKKDKDAKSCLVGGFLLEMEKLCDEGYVRAVPGFYILRFQRTGDRIEIAVNRGSKAKILSLLPLEYSLT
jgi:hypothetical protein